jgi:hypothetical protein
MALPSAWCPDAGSSPLSEGATPQTSSCLSPPTLLHILTSLECAASVLWPAYAGLPPSGSLGGQHRSAAEAELPLWPQRMPPALEPGILAPAASLSSTQACGICETAPRGLEEFKGVLLDLWLAPRGQWRGGGRGRMDMLESLDPGGDAAPWGA